MRGEDKEELLDALEATSNSPALDEKERTLLVRCHKLLSLSWSDEWLYLQVVVLENIEVARVEVQLPPRDEELWQYVLSRAPEAQTQLMRAATMCRYVWHSTSLDLPWASWLEMAGELVSRECHHAVRAAIVTVREAQ